ncbi:MULTISPECIES: diguanylate cyclase domain-containing protein [Bacillaceae]|uniref:diguanylate cyclase domain-containing protein n=1 Tax=Bacillaceae TaxID=186817 RepID=UPI000BFC9C88|nr:hypothetical protein COE25_08280 [Bacillus sp. AFS031507]
MPELLKQFSNRLVNNVRLISVLGRIGGDEFLILLKDIKHSQNVAKIARTWYYSSDSQINFRPNEKQLMILADHKTVYPTQ